MPQRAARLLAGALLAITLARPAASEPAETEAPETERVVALRRGETLAGLLAGAGVDRAEAHEAATALERKFPARALRPGQEVALRLDPGRDNALLEIEIEPQPGRTFRVLREGPGWKSEEIIAPRRRHLARAEGVVRGGLLPALTTAGLPAGLGLSLIRALSHEIDFQRDLQPGDRFQVLFERFRDAEGDLLGHGRILAAELTLSGRRIALWRHETPSGADWFDAEGHSLHRALLRTPLDGARISSGFGMRSHPILGFSRMHQGIDFAAPTGTPVFAAGDGVVASAKVENGYGRIVRLRHAGGIETRYAHLSRFARGIALGRTVKQGDVIGMVGATGFATGPHLHYEIAVSGTPVDPATRARDTVRLAGRDLNAFQANRRMLERLSASIAGDNEVAMAE